MAEWLTEAPVIKLFNIAVTHQLIDIQLIFLQSTAESVIQAGQENKFRTVLGFPSSWVIEEACGCGTRVQVSDALRH